jgi:hypothetical protein
MTRDFKIYLNRELRKWGFTERLNIGELTVLKSAARDGATAVDAAATIINLRIDAFNRRNDR